MKKRVFAICATAFVLATQFLMPLFSIAEGEVLVQQPVKVGETLVYEAENSVVNGGTSVASSYAAYSGTGYIFLGNGGFTMSIAVPYKGKYKLEVSSANDNNGGRCDYLSINGGAGWLIATSSAANKTWELNQPGTENWVEGALKPVAPAEGFDFVAGTNTVTFTANWGYCAYDRIILTPLDVEIPTDADVENVIALIEALPDTITLEDKAAVTAANNAYLALTEEQRGKVSNYSVLESALETIEQLEASYVQQPVAAGDTLVYEAEKSVVNGGTSIASSYASYSGTGYVFLGDGGFTMKIHVPAAGKYKLEVSSANDNNGGRCDFLSINGGANWLIATSAAAVKTWELNQLGTENWVNGALKPIPPAEGFDFTAGTNTIAFSANWGYCAYDRIILTPMDNAAPSPEATQVINLIDALPDTITLADKAAVTAANNAYLALTEEQKSEVGNYSLLEAALAAIDQLEKSAAQQPVNDGKKLVYEAELGVATGGTSVGNTFASFSGTGYMFLGDGGFTMKIHVPKAGKYRLNVAAANDSNGGRCDFITINGGTKYLIATPGDPVRTWVLSEPGTENWVNNALQPIPPEGGFDFVQGTNTITFSANWGYCAYDRIILAPFGDEEPIDKTAVEKVNDLIAALPVVVTIADKNAVNEAYAAYTALTATDKKQVVNMEKLLIARAGIMALAANKDASKGTLRYELEEGKLTGNTSVVTEKSVFSNYSGSGYVFLFDQKMSMDIFVPSAGRYYVYVVSGATENGGKCDFVSINGGEKLLVSTPAGSKGKWIVSQPGTEAWENNVLKPVAPSNGFALNAGKNTIEISANWGYNAYDSVILVPLDTIGSPDTGESSGNLATATVAMFSLMILFGFVTLCKLKAD
ncbi:MAG: hypothetical protein PHR14_00845 [Oscillospiraceae bacterium]|nr:hypothetical protein [Oscillospiraceae bacterium]